MKQLIVVVLLIGLMISPMKGSSIIDFPVEDMTFYGDAYQATNNNQISLNGTGAWVTSYSNETFHLPIHLEFTSTNTAKNIIGLQPVGGQETQMGWNDDAYKTYFNSGNSVYGKFPNVWDIENLTYTPGDLIEIDIDVYGNLVVTSGGSVIYTGEAPMSDYRLALSSFTEGSVDNIELTASRILIQLDEFPEKLQFYARDLQTNKAVIPITGTVNTIGDSLSVVVLRDGQPYSQQGIKPTGLNFELNLEVDAELVQYTVELYVITSGNTTLYQVAENVVAGDVYIITGQSNAEAMMYDSSASENNSDFIRVYGLGSDLSSILTSNLKWFIGQGDGSRNTAGNTGQWGFHMAKQIVDNQRIPVCIFNGARGGWPIINFIKDDALPENLETNYGRLLYRLNRTKLTDKVRAIFWYQGESDAGDMLPMLTYKERFVDLYDDWKADFPSVEQVYITQIRDGCSATQEQNVIIQEALRQLVEELPNTNNIMSAKGLAHDGCHFPYEGGYKELGNRYYRLISRDIYNESFPSAASPDIKHALFSANNEIIIETKYNDNLIWENGADTYFQLEGSAASVIGGSTLGNYIILQLDSDGSDATGLTYFDEREIVSPYIINEEGHGLVSFYDFPISINSVPIAMDDNFSTMENTPLSDDLSPNDNDPDGNNLLWTTNAITPPTNGTLDINLDGTFTYTPNAYFYGTDSFTYQVCDDYIPVTTYNGQVNSGTDDVEEMAADGSMNTDSGDLDIMDDTNIVNAAGIRITNINIPKNALITNAYLEFVADESNTEPTTLTISAEATANAAPIPTTTNALSTKTKTTAVNWSNIPFWTAGNTYASSDISAVIQQLVSRGDWESGNAMTFIIEGTGIRTVESYEGGAALAPKLSVTYKTGNPLNIQTCDEASVNITVEQVCVDLNIHAFLEGAFNPALGEMRNTLVSTRKLLPGQTPTSNLATPTPAGQPYSGSPWNYSGTESAAWTDADYTGDETDWVLVSFRTDIPKNTEVGMTAALLNKDGRITFPDRCALTSTVASPLYIVIEHRNHIGVMTPQPVDIIASTLSYDFRLADSYKDLTSSGQKEILPGIWGMFAGDGDQSDFPSFDIKGTDKTIWLDDNGVFQQYLIPDFDLNGDVNGADKALWDLNNGVSSRVPK